MKIVCNLCPPHRHGRQPQRRRRPRRNSSRLLLRWAEQVQEDATLHHLMRGYWIPVCLLLAGLLFPGIAIRRLWKWKHGSRSSP